jgi:DNA mismatch repair protein MutS2
MQLFEIPARTRRDLGWDQIVAAVAARTATARGRERALALPFLGSKDEIVASLDRIAEIRELLRKELALPLAGAEDVRGPLARAGKGAILEAPEMIACARLIRAAARVRGFLAAHRGEAPILAAAGEALPDASSIASRIETAFEPSGRLKDSASGTLSSLRDRARGLHRQIKERLEGMLHDEKFTMNLRDNYYSIRNDRYVVPVNSSFRAEVPGIVHNASNSGQTIFVEPDQLVGLGNELSIAESLAAEEERRVLAELSGDLGDRGNELLGAVEILGELDLVEAEGRLAEALDATPPVLAEGRAPFSLKSARHPILALQGKKVVANHISLAADQKALVVSGPNAGGKTVTITTVGLAALLVRAGLPVPADRGSVVPLWSSIHTAIGDAQDLGQDLSTFSAHVTALRGILDSAREGSLALVDEIAADTDPREGAALAAAVLGELVDAGAAVLVTTHLEELKALGFADPRFANARVGLDPRTLAPTFRLELGSAGVSSALEIAARCGLPAPVLERAKKNLHGGAALPKALERLEEERMAHERARLDLEDRRREIERLKAELDRAKAELGDVQRDIEIRVREEMLDEVEQAHREVGELVASLTKRPDMKKAVETQEDLKARAERIARERDRLRAKEEAEKKGQAAAPDTKVRPGMRVQVVPLGREAEVIEVSADEAMVAAGPLKLRVKLADVVPLTGKAKAAQFASSGGKAERLAKAAKAAGGAVGEPEARCDVRGLRAEDAVREVELFLDRKYTEGAAAVLIVHGHGTGALKKLLREHLAASPYVAGHRAGEGHEGGDGVTVVELRT